MFGIFDLILEMLNLLKKMNLPGACSIDPSDNGHGDHPRGKSGGVAGVDAKGRAELNVWNNGGLKSPWLI